VDQAAARESLSTEVQAGLENKKRETRQTRKRDVTLFSVVSLVCVLLLALLWTQLLTPAQTRSKLSQQVDSSLIGDTGNSPLVGLAGPDFTLSSVSAGGKVVHLADFKGKPVVLNFWASWCTPCNTETPFLQHSAAHLQAQGVVLVGVDGSEKAGDGAAFLQKYGVTYTNLQDTLDGATAVNYGVTSFPETIFLNTHGIVVAKWVGAIDERGLQSELAKLSPA
jgi:cytochrome c biogenesis protein CcmG/thiol:disulfide interchange protein DsbE